ncbi:MAG TPA: Hdr-like menaquinol oxidoreductase cytochrome c subunit [Chromatiaceae bacterium]|nr:Hdr-like menaquinol oxidoreductase cytochrome c subunit [Chromatiaceae bacterium]
MLPVLLVSSLWLAGAFAGEAVEGTAKADKLESCVEPTDVMRRNHFEFILHQRDLTVHQGIRGAKHSLVGCVDCHAKKDAQGKPVPVNAEGQFCAGCHEYAAVNIDCFSCHSTVPGEK